MLSPIPAAIEELMRFESPVLLGHRWITEDIEVVGRRFEGGTKVTVVWASANVDPDAVADPLTVDLERTDCRHVSFASGFHRCLGSHLARLELRIALEELNRRLPDYRITPGCQPAVHQLRRTGSHRAAAVVHLAMLKHTNEGRRHRRVAAGCGWGASG